MRRLAIAATTVACLVAALLVNATPASAATSTTTAANLLHLLPVRAESHSTTYARTSFRYWVDADRDHCNTRAELLIARSKAKVTYGSGCTVRTGRWYSYYDGKWWTLASDVDIDHVVALKEAWESGAWAWTSTKREHYANDLGYAYTLEIVTDNVNEAKGDRDPAQWLPPLASVRCGYAIRWVAIKYRWGLSVDTAERNRLASMLSGSCGAVRLTVPPRGA